MDLDTEALDETRYSWVAVQGVTPADLLASLSLVAGDEVDGVPNFGIAELPDGWVAIVQTDPDAAFRAPLSGLTRRDLAVTCSENRSALRTEARSYAAGEEVWRVVVDGEAASVLTHSGEPPEAYDALVDNASWDIFQETPRREAAAALQDIPLILALMECGLRLGEEPEGLRWSPLQPI